jgi:hypothetical protein
MGADAAGAAAGVSDRTEPGAGAAVGESVDHGNVEARLRVQCWQKAGVVDGDGVVALLRLRTVVRDAHERKRYGPERSRSARHETRATCARRLPCPSVSLTTLERYLAMRFTSHRAGDRTGIVARGARTEGWACDERRRVAHCAEVLPCRKLDASTKMRRRHLPMMGHAGRSMSVRH